MRAIKVMGFAIILAMSFGPISIALSAVSYILAVTNNIEISNSTTPEGQIGYIGEDHTGWPGYYATQGITANPPDGYTFTGWSGDVPAGLEAERSITVTMDQDRTITASFTQSTAATFFYLNVSNDIGVPASTSPAEGQIRYFGENHPEWPGYYATQGITANPPDGYTFTGWSGDVPAGLEAQRSIIVTMDQDRTITANFTQSTAATFFYLNVSNDIGVPSSTSPAEGQIGYIGENHPEWPGYYATQGITANPPDGYTFTGWSGDVPAGLEAQRSITVTMDQDRTITANFTQSTTATFFYLNVSNDIGVPSSTSPAEGQIGYIGENHSEWPGYYATQGITANPPDGYTFTGWSGDVLAGLEAQRSITVTMDQDRTITANFTQSTTVTFFYLNVGNNIGVPNSTFPSMGQIGYLGENHPDFVDYATQDMYAMPPDGYIFTHWTGDVPASLEEEKSITVTMNQHRTIVANFTTTNHFTVTTRGYIHSSPLLYDINQDGYREVIVGDMAGYVYCFDYQGNSLWEYYAGDAFDQSISPVPEFFNDEVKNNTNLGNITIQSSPAAGDLDGDDLPEIIVGVGGFVDLGTGGVGGTTTGYGPVGQGGILILSNQGKLKLLIRGWDTYDGLGNPVQDGYSDGFYSTAALADLNKDGYLDVVIGGTDQNIYALKAMDHDPTVEGGEIIRFFNPPGKNSFWMAPIYEMDDDGDGKFNEDPVGDMTPITYYDTSDDVSGFAGMDDDDDTYVDEGAPGDDDEDSSSAPGVVNWEYNDEDEFEWPFRNTDTVVSSPALADIDANGFLDIIVGVDSAGGGPLKANRKEIPAGGALRVMDLYSNEIGSFPQWIEQVVMSTPSVGDVDQDGNVEIFHGTGSFYPIQAGEGVYAFKNDGTAYLNPMGKSPGDAGYGLFASTDNVVWGAPALGDLDGDGEIEIVAADFSGYLYVWDSQGVLLSGFPMLPLQEHPGDQHPHIKSSPILVDVDSDSLPEIVIGAGWSIVAVNGDSSIVPTFRYGNTGFTTGTTAVFATPASADLDGNGKVDLVWVTGMSSDGGATVDNGMVHIWELGNFNKDANPWPMFKRTASRISSYRLNLENPIFGLEYSEGAGCDLLTVSVDVIPGLLSVANLDFKIAIDGRAYIVSLADDGANGDRFSGDGRYTAQLPFPEGIVFSDQAVFLVAEVFGTYQEFNFAFNAFGLQVESSVGKFYRDILDRLPESGGAEGWRSEIERIVGLGVDVKEGFIALAKFFFNSDEYLLRNKTDAEYVADLYETFLNRTPSGDEIDYWSGFLQQGLVRNVILNYFAYSEEFRLFMEGLFGPGSSRAECDLVNDFYRGILNRLPDTGGFNAYLAMMRNAQCSGAEEVRDLSHTIALGFVSSQEYAQRNRTNKEYVEDLYNGILRRGASVEEFGYWVGFLDAGTYTREELLTFFTSSAEFQLCVQGVIDVGCL